MIAFVAADVAPWLALVGAVGAGGAIFRSNQTKSSIAQVKTSLDVITAANEELRLLVGHEKREREEDRRQCDASLAEMRGQLATLTGAFGRQIATAIVDEWRKIEQPKTSTSTTVSRTRTVENDGD